MSLVIKDAKIIGKEGNWDVLIDDGKIKSISEKEDGAKSLDASNKYLSPGFFNTHTHAAMSLFRGVADDREFWDAWPEVVWPLEEKLEAEDVYWGTKLACLEMIKTGTVAFNDMYFFMESAVDAVEEMGVKAVMSYGLIDEKDPDKLEDEIVATKNFVEYAKDCKNIKPALGPHAIYTVSRDGLEWCSEFAEKEDLLVNIHLGETEKETKDFKKDYSGTFSEYLAEVGLLNERTIAAHCVWLEDQDFSSLAENNVTVSHNPSSNMKLGVGKPMEYERMSEEGVEVTLGTDSTVSNNNLDMLEEAKTAALQQKMSGDATLMSAEECYKMLTKEGAKAMGFKSGVIEEGRPADLILLDKDVKATPEHDDISNLIYSMDGSSVTAVIIDGKVVMEERKVKGEKEIIKNATARSKQLVSGVI